jgi:glycosyltransferase involved in cell wall biosynthesis
MKNQITISIIIVTYNAEKDIASCLDSLKKFIDDKTEVIIIDGVSNDNTLGIIKKYSDIISVLISEKDFGIYDAMNKGVKKASGNFIYFLGADDTLAMNFHDLYSILVDSNTIYYGDVILKPSNKIYGGKFNTLDIINRNICHQSIFYPKEVFKTYSYGSDFKFMEDYYLNLKLWSSKKYKFQYLNALIANYSIDGLSSMNIDDNFKTKSFKIIYNYFGIWGLLLKLTNPFQNLIKKFF